MRILFFQRDYYPLHQPDVAVLFGKYLQRYGIKTDLVSVTDTPLVDSLWLGGSLRLRYIPRKNFWGRLSRILHCIWCMVKYGRDCDILQVRNDSLLGFAAAIVAFFYSKRFYFWMSFPYPEADRLRAREQHITLGFFRLAYVYIRSYVSYYFQYYIVMRLAHFCFVQSEAMLNALVDKGLELQVMRAVPMGVDLDALPISNTTIDSRTSEQQYCISYIGALDKIRRPDLMCEVLSKVRKIFPAARLLLIGDAKEKADKIWLQKRIAELGLSDAVEISGWVDRGRAWALAQSSTVSVCALPQGYVFQSMSPTKLVELLALKVPVVATPHPEHRELLGDGERGLIASTDPESLAAALLDVFSSPQRAAQRAEAGFVYISAHRSYAVIAGELATLYMGMQQGVKSE